MGEGGPWDQTEIMMVGDDGLWTNTFYNKKSSESPVHDRGSSLIRKCLPLWDHHGALGTGLL